MWFKAIPTLFQRRFVSGAAASIYQKKPKDTLLNMDFYMKLAKNIGLKEFQVGSNFLFSPLSIHVVLSMVAAGASGRTLKQILSLLKSESIHDLNSAASQLIRLISSEGTREKEDPLLAMVNGIWVDKSLSLTPSFKETMNTIFRAEAKEVDFQTKAHEVIEEVNLWAERATNGLIKDAVPGLDISDVLVLANALYFKGVWKEKFDPTVTQKKEFHLLNGQIVHVPSMTSTRSQCIKHFYSSNGNIGFKVLKLPYQGALDRLDVWQIHELLCRGTQDVHVRQFSMYFFLPDERDGLPNLIQNLSSPSGLLNDYFCLRQVPVGKFWLPKFKISFAMNASQIMKESGLVLPFLDMKEFPNMVYSEENVPFCISKIFHKSVVEVNEDGAEAAAVTVSGVLQTSSGRGGYIRPERIDFVADHPFMFMIREDEKRVVLFVGSVIDPSKLKTT